MGSYIIKIRDRYYVWSTIVDAPVTAGMTLEGLREHVAHEDGKRGLDALPSRLERVERTGTSSYIGETLNDLLRYNRAGPGESWASASMIYDWYSTPEAYGGRDE